MLSGLRKPYKSREHKEALIELQRQIAPVTAVLVPLLCVIVLFVATAVDTSSRREIKVDIITAEEPPEVEDIPEPVDVKPPEHIEEVDVSIDSPTVGDVS